MAAELEVYPNDAAEGLHSQAGFVALPRKVLFRPGLSDGAKVLFAALLSYAWGEGACWPGQTRLAQDLGVGERTVRARLQELVGANLLRVVRRGCGRTNTYLLTCPDEPAPGDRHEASAVSGRILPVRTAVDVEPDRDVKPPPPPPPVPTEEEDESARADDGAVATELLALGMDREEAREWGRRHDPETVAEAVTLTRERATADPVRYCRRVLENWLVIGSPGTRTRRELAATNEVGERFRQAEEQEQTRRRDLRRRFDELPDEERARLVDAARQRIALLRDRPAEHPAVIGAAVEIMREGVTV